MKGLSQRHTWDTFIKKYDSMCFKQMSSVDYEGELDQAPLDHPINEWVVLTVQNIYKIQYIKC